MDIIFENVNKLFENPSISEDIPLKIIISVLIIASVIFLRKILLSYFIKKLNNNTSIYRLQKTTGFLSFAVIFTIMTFIWFHFTRNLVTILGVLSAGIAIAARDIIMDIAGWIYLISAKPFELGDRIEIGETAGDVVDIRVFKFTLMEIGNWVESDQSTGRIIHMPNTDIFNKPIANYSKGFYYIWDEITLSITFDSNWQKAKIILTDMINEHSAQTVEDPEYKVREASRKIMINYSKLTPIVYTALSSYSINLTLRYLTPPRKRRVNREILWERILKMLSQNTDIKIAYPASRVKLDNDNVMVKTSDE